MSPPNLPRLPNRDIGQQLDNNEVIEEFEDRDELARLRGKSDLTGTEKAQLDDLEMAHQKLSKQAVKDLKEKAEPKDAVSAEEREEKMLASTPEREKGGETEDDDQFAETKMVACDFIYLFILFYFILFYFILFYFILFYFILFYFILFYFILFYFIFNGIFIDLPE
jgi:hypothetical protein